MKSIVLIQPKEPETYLSHKSFSIFTKKPVLHPPLGLATIAALTPLHYKVKIIDERIEEIDFSIPCDIVGITGYRFYEERIIEISNEFKKRGVLTVGGGIYCTTNFRDALKHFDVVISGEAEHTWPQFLNDWERGSYRSCYIEKELIDIKYSPIPRWDLIQWDKYTVATIQTSRGCPHDCEFCDVVHLFGRELRVKTHYQIFQELKNISSYGVPYIFFVDDNFFANKQYAKELLKSIIRFNRLQNRPIMFTAQTTLDLAGNEELLDLVKDANFIQLFIGIESPRKASLISCNKHHNLNIDMFEAIKKIQSRGIIIIAGMIVGFDTDDITIFEEQRRFLKKSGLILPNIKLLVASPFTKLWHRLAKAGRLLPHIAEDPFSTVNFIPLLMSKEKLESEHLKLLRTVYSIEHFKESFLSFIKQIDTRQIRRNAASAGWLQLRIMNKDILMIGLRIIRFYVFQAGKDKRRLFFFMLKHAFAKGVICLPMVLSVLMYFQSINRFVNRKVI
jgi:radical SAM superfamily enzyme YgiQ (UPF0313 family)